MPTSVQLPLVGARGQGEESFCCCIWNIEEVTSWEPSMLRSAKHRSISGHSLHLTFTELPHDPFSLILHHQFKKWHILRKHRSAFRMAVFYIIVFREKKGFVIVSSQHFRGDCPTNSSQMQWWSFFTLACNTVPQTAWKLLQSLRIWAASLSQNHGSSVRLTRDGFQSVASVAKNKKRLLKVH